MYGTAFATLTSKEEESLVLMIRRLRNEGRSFIRKREHLLQILNAAPPSANSGMTQKELKASLQTGESAPAQQIKVPWSGHLTLQAPPKKFKTQQSHGGCPVARRQEAWPA